MSAAMPVLSTVCVMVPTHMHTWLSTPLHHLRWTLNHDIAAGPNTHYHMRLPASYHSVLVAIR